MKPEYCQNFAKNWIFEQKKIWKNSRPGIEPGTFQLWALSQDHYTKRTCLKLWQRAMLYQVNIHFLHFAKAAGISNVQIFESLRSPRDCVFQVGDPNYFDICSGGSKVYVMSFFLYLGDFSFQDSQTCLT